MSLSREAMKEGCEYLKDNSAQMFGHKFFDCRVVSVCQICQKSDKFETRFLAICKYRVFIVYGKNPANFKLERSFNLLTLRQLLVQNKELIISYEDKPKSQHKLIYRSEDTEPLQMAKEILSALKHYLPDIGPSLSKFIQIQPDSLLNEFPLLPSSQPSLPCHNFRRTYVTICDLIDQPYNEEIIWDVDRIYFINKIRDIRLEDFGHLSVKDQVAVIGSAQFSSYFTGITVEATRLAAEHVEMILNVVRRSTALKSLRLTNCGLPKDFCYHLGNALSANPDIPLSILDLGGNQLDDKKYICHLSSVLPCIRTLKSISFADCGLSDKSIHHLASGLTTGLTIDKNGSGNKFELKRLILSRCSSKDDPTELINFVSVCGSLRALDLSGTGVLVDKLWSALKLGGLQLEQLNLSGCQTLKKHKEGVGSVKELFSCMVNLKELNLSNTPLSADLLQAILQGLSANSQLTDIKLNLDGACGDKGCGLILEQYLPFCPVAFLSLRDNNLEQNALKIFAALRTMTSLQSLDVGGNNFIGLRVNKKYNGVLSKVVNELTKLIASEEVELKELILSDAKLGNFLTILLNALSVANIEQLDICNNEIGNSGARLLSKALQMNTSLKVIAFDRNQIGLDGFQEIAYGLRLNHSVTSIPFPSIDIAEALTRPERAKVLSTVAEIEVALERNRKSPKLFELHSQKILNDLNNHCDKYEVNNNTQKKVVFHTLTEVLSELEPSSTSALSPDNLIHQLSSDLSQLAKESSNKFCQLIQKRLAEQNVDILEPVGNCYPEDLDESVKKQFEDKINAFVRETCFQTAFNQLDKLLTQPEAFKLRGSISNLGIENSVHINQFSARTITPMAHRPNSALILEDSPKKNGNDGNKSSPSSPLIHLVKNRPPPPRILKHKVFARSVTPVVNGDNNSTMTSSIHSSNSSNVSSTESKNVSEEADPSSEAPPLIPRRTRLPPMPNHPPRLPPKPGSDSPSSTRSPTDLRNHRTRVLPALDEAMLAFKDPDDSS
ncbi:unnamed protein product [Bursaphelenchus xylophilus]|uniref:(pine wood nematode) hypothetical protein n=1 Tax=Bursaphelenchus xylophilus TaxID=6326 RepID=A0A1I7RLG3_BURXY|nr:unnamed protein product [Bursaphelenchus xylophilus]CAG9083013.1 unnamed protein product [Bursaphelenchus xylophilus]